jgi:phosphopantetheinyl transferase
LSIILHENLRLPGEWGLWHITESEAWLRENVELHPPELENLSLIKGEGRRREFLAARILLHFMSGRAERGALLKDECGKPHLEDSTFHVSISHTVNYAAAIAHPNLCGIDVQRFVPRIRRLADKYIGIEEKRQLLPDHELIQHHILWAAKEAVYKAYGRRQLDFREHIFIDFEGYSPDKTTASALLKKDDWEICFDLDFRIYEDFVLVGAVERTVPVPPLQ